MIKDVIKSHRLKLGLTMKELADKVGVSEATISRWESGEISNMKRSGIAALADALKISPMLIMGWEDEEDNKYYINPETAKLAQEALEDPDVRILLSAKRDLSPEAMKHIIETVKIWRKAEHPELYPEDYPDEEYPEEVSQDPEDWD